MGAGGVGKTRLALEAGRTLAAASPAAPPTSTSPVSTASPGARGRVGARRRRGDAGRARRAARARHPRRGRAARARRLRALPRRRRGGRPTARRGAEPDRAGHQPRAVAPDRRARLPRAAARGLQRRRAVQGARGRVAPGLGAGRRRPVVAADLRAAGRAAAGDRARRRPRALAAAAGAAGAPRAPAGAAELRAARPAGAPAVAARDAGVVVGGARPAQRRVLARLCVFEGGASLEAFHAVCNPEGGAGRGAARRDHGQDVAGRRRGRRGRAAAPGDARHGPRVRRRAARAERSGRCWSSATPPTSSPTPNARPTGGGGPAAWLARLARERGNLRIAFERLLPLAGPRTRCGSRSPSPARCRGTRTRTRCAPGCTRRSFQLAPEPSPLRAAALYWDGQLALSQARFAAAEAPLEQALARRGRSGYHAGGRRLTALGRRAVLIADPGAALCAAAVDGARRRRSRPVADALWPARCVRARRRSGSAPRTRRRGARAVPRGRRPYGVAGALGEQGFYDIVHGRLERPSSGSARRSSCAASSATTAGWSSR